MLSPIARRACNAFAQPPGWWSLWLFAGLWC
jgi:hypothetical protein